MNDVQKLEKYWSKSIRLIATVTEPVSKRKPFLFYKGAESVKCSIVWVYHQLCYRHYLKYKRTKKIDKMSLYTHF
jgi:hypothetical protein